MRSLLRQFFNGEITVDERSWHYHVYTWYMTSAKEPTPTRENLCHYMRVLLIWSPIFWFMTGRLYKWVQPWMIVGAILWATIFVEGNANFRAVLILATIGIGTALYVMTHDTEVSLFQRRITTLPLSTWLLKYALDPFATWFFGKGILKVIYPWSVALTLFLGYLAWGITINHLWQGLLSFFLKLFGVCVALLLFAIVAMIIGIIIDEYRKSRAAFLRYRPQRTSTFSLLIQFLLAKKRKICPFIVLPSQKHDTPS